MADSVLSSIHRKIDPTARAGGSSGIDCAPAQFLAGWLSISRRTIQAATKKSEAFNLFVQWVAFGGGPAPG